VGKSLQLRYKSLDEERRELKARVDALEEKVMAEAEPLNDTALAQINGDAAE